MRPPGLPWIGYNLLRLVSVVFLWWALVAQFIVLSNDLSEYSKAPSSSALTISNIPGPLSTSNTANPSIVASTRPVAVQTTSTRNPYAAPTIGGATTATAPIGTTTVSSGRGATVSPSTGDEDDEEPIRIGTTAANSERANLRKRDGEAEEVGQANWGLSSIPRQSGGMLFSVLSRIVMGCTLILLTLGQLGWPEMFLYRYIPWLGPQSTPVWLGLIQTILSIENLRVYAPHVLLPAWGVFATGLINMILGGILLWLARKLPKKPAPPLYFNHSTRMLFFTRPPACYDALSRRPPAVDFEAGVEEKALPPSNSLAIGLDDSDDEEKALPLPAYPKATILPNRDMLPIEAQHPSRIQAHTDVRQGGYPTFSGGGLTDPGRQVPTGFLERGKDGRLLKFVNEDGDDTEPPATMGGTASSPPKTSRSGVRKPPPSAWGVTKTTTPSNGSHAAKGDDKADTDSQRQKQKQKREDLPPRGQLRKLTAQPTDPKSRGISDRRSTVDTTSTTSSWPDPSLNGVISPLRRADSVDTIALISRRKPARSQTHDSALEFRSRDEGSAVVQAAKEARRTRSRSILLGLGSAFGESKLPPWDSSKKPREASWDPLPPPKIDGERPDSLCSISATNELGQRFPLPPDRQETFGVMRTDISAGSSTGDHSKAAKAQEARQEESESESPSEDGLGVDQATVSRKPSVRDDRAGPVPPKRTGSKKGKEEKSDLSDDKAHDRHGRGEKAVDGSRGYKDKAGGKGLELRREPSTERRGKNQHGHGHGQDDLTSPKTPRSAKSKSKSKSKPSTPTTSSTRNSFRLSLTGLTGTRKRAATLHSDPHPPKPTLALGRSSSARSTKTAKGVRFALSPARSTATPSGAAGGERVDEDDEDDGRHKSRRNTVDSFQSVPEQHAQSRSGRSQRASQSEKSHDPEVVRVHARVEPSPKRSKTVLGGEYLDGGKEHI